MGPQLLDVVKFKKRCNPLIGNPWRLSTPISSNDVETAINTNNLTPPPTKDSWFNNITRIAWFVVHGWDSPIEIDVGIPMLGCNPAWPLEDGNHRFAAAIIRNDISILANISGALDEIEKFLYIDIIEDKHI